MSFGTLLPKAFSEDLRSSLHVAYHMTTNVEANDEYDTGITVLSSVSLSNPIASPVSNHPLQGEGDELIMGSEEQGRLLKGKDSNVRPSYNSRPQSFAGRGLLGMGRPAGTSGTLNPGISNSWGHPEMRGRSLDLQGDAIPRAGSIPPRPSSSLYRSASQYGNPSVGTGYEGHLSSVLNADGEAGVQTWRAGAVGATPLERTIDAIGMGRYQYAVLILSGFGWAADNMWLQGVAIVLPRVQDEWQIGDQWIGLVSSCTFAGMMVGALAWGSCK
jgi:hypothetical protein